MRRVVIKSVVLALLGTVGISKVAFAYIDPTTGGMLVQVLATSVAMFTGLALLFSRQIRTLLGRAKRALRHTPDDEDQQALDAVAHSQDAQDLRDQ